MRTILQSSFSHLTCISFVFILSACGGGGGSDPQPTQNPSPTPTSTATPGPVSTPTPSPAPSSTPTPASTVTLSGTVTYDYVPHKTTEPRAGALMYGNTSEEPVRFATVALLDADDTLLAWGQTNESGQYSFTVGENVDVKVRVLAELKTSGGPIYDIKVTDNTEENALYVLEGDVDTTGTSNSVRDLHAPSGWTGTEYGEQRAAAPFAILDSIWQAVVSVLDAEPNIFLPAVELRWSTRNIPVNGDPADGDIGTSYYDGQHIYLLGHEDNDTDEYDRSVVQHEFAHYLNDTLTRDDSIGGLHGGSTPTDMRVAYSEGSANAFTALVSGSGVYQDSYDSMQDNGFREELENNNLITTGFFSEDTAGQLIYDLFDDDVDGSDNIDLDMDVFYNTLMDPDYAESPALTSLYLFIDVLRANVTAGQALSIDNLLLDHEVFGIGPYGEDETNANNIDLALPIYHELVVDDTVEVCSESLINNFNGLDVRRFVRFTITQQGRYSISAVRTSGNRQTNPQIRLFSAERRPMANFYSGAGNQELGEASLTTGDYVLEIFDQIVIDDISSATYNEVCFDVSVSQ